MGEDNNTGRVAEKKNYKKILGYIGTAVFLATILLIVFIVPGKQKADVADANDKPSQAPAPSESFAKNTASPAGETDDAPAAAPFLYEKNSYIYMASGKKKICLGSRKSIYGCYKEINGILSNDDRYLYYIENTDINTGQGALKKVSANAASSPVTIENGVCAAEVSPDGSSVIYVKNVNGIAGWLYLYKDGNSSFIDKNVLPVSFRFSQGGSCISYIVQEGAGAFALYVKSNAGKPKLAARFTAEATASDGIVLSRFNGAVPFDSGQVVYSIEENYNMQLYFYNTNGETERICDDGYIIKTYPNGDTLYADIAGSDLWYKSPGADAVKITENYGYSRFPEGTNRFLLMENIGDGYKNSSVMMYEIGENREKAAISLGDDKIFLINKSFDCVAYEREGKFYVSRKTDTGWREIGLIKTSGNKPGGSRSSIDARFGGESDCLYFFNKYKSGPLYRYSLKEDKTVKLLKSVDSLYVNERTVYAHAAGDKLYRVDGGAVKNISEDIRNVMETRGGAFLFSGSSIRFVSDGSQSWILLDKFTRPAVITGSIEYRPPLAEDLSAALKVLSREANYCLYKLGAYRRKTTESIAIRDAAAIAKKLAGRNDLIKAERSILKYMASGFKAYEANKRKTARSYLQKAVNAYEKYINSVRNEEEK